MKKNYVLLGFFSLFSICTSAQAIVSDTITFESFNLPMDSYQDRAATGIAGGTDYFKVKVNLTSNTDTVRFINHYDTTYNYAEGFSISTMRDTITPDFTNQFSVISGSGYTNSPSYMVAYQGYIITQPEIILPLLSLPEAKYTLGMYVNNSTYAYYSMKNGDGVGKKFGSDKDAYDNIDGTNGEDWFMLTIFDTDGDSVDFYLADYRFADSTQDYIVKEWTYIDLSSLSIDFANPKVSFLLRSSDNGAFGMNTPAYFCMDNFTINVVSDGVGISNMEEDRINIFPNPAQDYITIQLEEDIAQGNVTITDLSGKVIRSIVQVNGKQAVVDVTSLDKGMYVLTIQSNQKRFSKSFIKN